MSAALVNLVLRARAELPVSSPCDWAVLVVLADYTNDDDKHPLRGFAWVSETTIAAQVHAGERSVQRSLHDLKGLGLVHLEKRGRRDFARWRVDTPLLRKFVAQAEAKRQAELESRQVGGSKHARPANVAVHTLTQPVLDPPNLQLRPAYLATDPLIERTYRSFEDIGNQDQAPTAGREFHKKQIPKPNAAHATVWAADAGAARPIAEVRADMRRTAQSLGGQRDRDRGWAFR